MAYAGKGISVLNPNRNDDIVRNDKRIGQERTLNGGRAIQQNVIVGVQGCLIERLPETEKALDGIGKRPMSFMSFVDLSQLIYVFDFHNHQFLYAGQL